jgi:hypothetical protein
MDWRNPQSVETHIKRLTREIAEIEAELYVRGNEKDRILRAGMLERQRDDMVRSAVLQLHTSIEDLLTQLIHYCALNIRERRLRHRLHGDRGKAYRRMLYGHGSLGFDMKLNFAQGLGLISDALRKQLTELNSLRNKCAHNWQLNAVVRRGKKRRQKKPPLLLFRQRDLHKVPVLKDFIGEYGSLYVHLYAKWVS